MALSPLLLLLWLVTVANSLVTPPPSVNLNALIKTRSDDSKSKAKDILQQIQLDHEQSIGAHHPNFNEQKKISQTTQDLSVDWIHDEHTKRRIAALTTKPLLLPINSTALLLRDAMTEYWKTHSSVSRYTYPGNQEAHLKELCDYNETVRVCVQEMMQQRLYPMLRQHYSDLLLLGGNDDEELCLYDSLFIRYNGTGAGLPFHRDLGLVSVNIMLNDEGGGTLFESLLRTDQPVVAPLGVGHALLHESHQRHAGIVGDGTAVRDIWVLFITTRRIPPRDVATRLKMRAEKKSPSAHHQLLLYKLALQAFPEDGEAWHYLGMALHKQQQHGSIACLEHARDLIPNDANLHNNIGLVLEQQQQQQQGTASLRAFEQCLQLYKRARQCGYNDDDLSSSAWNYALVLNARRMYKPAVAVLELVDRTSPLWEKARALRQHCQQEMCDHGIMHS